MNKLTSIAIMNNKGGPGKTCCVSNLAYCLTELGHKVLVIDTDPQGNLSRNSGFEPRDYKNRKGLYEYLNRSNDNINLLDYIQHTEYGVDIITSDNRIGSLLLEMSSKLAKFDFIYVDLLSKVTELNIYDFVIFDTRPSVEGENTQVLFAVDYLIIPTTLERNSIEGLNDTLTLYNQSKKFVTSLKVQLLGIVLNKVKTNTSIAKDIIPSLQEGYGNFMLNTMIHNDEKFAQTEYNNTPVAMYAKTSRASKEFYNLAKEVLTKIE